MPTAELYEAPERQRRTYHHGNLRATLIEKGAQIIEKGGIPALTLRAVAEAAGVSRQAPYHHFGDKDGLLAAIAIGGFEQLAHAMRIEAARHGSSDDRIVALGVAYVRLARQAPQRFELCSGTYIQDFSAHPELLQARNAAYAVLDAAMVEYLEAHRIPIEGAAVASGAAWAMAHGLARLLLGHGLRPGRGGLPKEREFVRQALQTLAKGIAAVRKKSQ